MTTRTYASVSEAVGVAAATILTRGGIRKPSPMHGGPPPDEWTAVVVLQCMREVGAPYDSDEGQAIIDWARAPDDVGLECDSQLRTLLSMLLEQIGLVRRPLRLDLPIGWRVHTRADGSPWVTCVVDPHPRLDPDVIMGSKSFALAQAKAGGVTVAVLPSVPDHRAETLAAIARGEPLMDVDRALAARLGCSLRTAWSHRTRWASEAEVVGAAIGG